MLKKRFKRAEIQRILQDYKNGMTIQTIIKENGISQATFYNWRAKYGSQSSYDNAHYINKLKDENDKLKRMYADLSLENLMLKSQLEKHE